MIWASWQLPPRDASAWSRFRFWLGRVVDGPRGNAQSENKEEGTK